MNIGIDVDGVLTNIEMFQLKYGKMYFKNNKNINEFEYDIEQIFNCTPEEREKFWIKYIFKYCMSLPVRNDASLIINKLREEGNKIIIITGRVHTKESGFVGDLFRKMLIDWLKKYNIQYDKIVYCNEKGSEIDKLQACKENNIDIMIDDKKENIMELSKITKVLCYDAKYNQECEGNNITRIHNFNDVYNSIKRIQNEDLFQKKSYKEINNLSNEEKIEYFKNLKKYYQNIPYDSERIKKEENVYDKFSKICSPIFNAVFKTKIFNDELVPRDGKGVIFASNHNNYYDQFPIIASLKNYNAIHFLTATKMLALKRGKLYLKTGVISVDREDKNDRKRANDEVRKILLNNGNVFIFPEGRTNRNENYLLDFHPGVVSAAQVTGCPIVPVAVNDHYKKEDGELCVRFGEPFYVLPTDDLDEMNDLLKEKIGTLLWNNMEYEYNNKKSKQKVLK